MDLEGQKKRKFDRLDELVNSSKLLINEQNECSQISKKTCLKDANCPESLREDAATSDQPSVDLGSDSGLTISEQKENIKNVESEITNVCTDNSNIVQAAHLVKKFKGNNKNKLRSPASNSIYNMFNKLQERSKLELNTDPIKLIVDVPDSQIPVNAEVSDENCKYKITSNVSGENNKEATSDILIDSPDISSILKTSLSIPPSSKKAKLTSKQLIRKSEQRERQEERERLRMEKHKLKKEKEEERKKLKEERKKRKIEELEVKLKEKEGKRSKKEEERLKKEEKKLVEEEEWEKKEKVKAKFAQFFVNKKLEPSSAPQLDKDPLLGPFMMFQIKENMKMAPVWRDTLSGERKTFLDRSLLNDSEDDVSNYLKDIKDKNYKFGRSFKTFQVQEKLEDNDCEVLDEDDEEIMKVSGLIEERENNHGKGHLHAKLLQFCENRRPAYFGTWTKKPKKLSARNPFCLEQIFDYDYDSDEDWEEEEGGESLSDSEGDGEETADGEGDQYEVDNDFFVPHGYLSDDEGKDENENEMEQSDTSACIDETVQKERLKQKQAEFDLEMKQKTKPLRPKVYGCVWLGNERSHAAYGQLIKILSSHRAMVMCGNFPIGIKSVGLDTPLDTPEIAKLKPGDEELEDTTTRRFVKSFPEEAVPDLIRLIHGNCHTKLFLVREFSEFWRRKEKSENEAYIAKRKIEPKIQELATYGRFSEGGILHKYRTWFVSKELREKYGLGDLRFKNTWSYTISPQVSRRDDGSLERQQKTEERHAETPKSRRSSAVNLITRFTKVLNEEEKEELLKKSLPSTLHPDNDEIQIVHTFLSDKKGNVPSTSGNKQKCSVTSALEILSSRSSISVTPCPRTFGSLETRRMYNDGDSGSFMPRAAIIGSEKSPFSLSSTPKQRSTNSSSISLTQKTGPNLSPKTYLSVSSNSPSKTCITTTPKALSSKTSVSITPKVLSSQTSDCTRPKALSSEISVCTTPKALSMQTSVSTTPKALSSKTSVCTTPKVLSSKTSVCTTPKARSSEISVCTAPKVLSAKTSVCTTPKARSSKTSVCTTPKARSSEISVCTTPKALSMQTSVSTTPRALSSQTSVCTTPKALSSQTSVCTTPKVLSSQTSVSTTPKAGSSCAPKTLPSGLASSKKSNVCTVTSSPRIESSSTPVAMNKNGQEPRGSPSVRSSILSFFKRKDLNAGSDTISTSQELDSDVIILE